MSAPTRTSDDTQDRVEVFAAACTGAGRLSNTIGLPVVCIGAALDADAAVRDLNDREHGSAMRMPDFFQPLGIENGWGDWALFDLAPEVGATGLVPPGIEIARGRVVVRLPDAVTLCEFREQLSASLRHLRLQEATIQASYLEQRSDALRSYVVHPRFTLRAPQSDFRQATLCEDLYVLDPAELGWRLVWIVVAARLAAGTGGRPLWR